MIYDPRPLTLKAADAPAPDLQATVIELAEMATALTGELEALRDLMTRWGTDPTGTLRRAQSRTVEHAEDAARVRDLVLTLSQGYRASGAYSSRGVS
jgi:hypothetical protein